MTWGCFGCLETGVNISSKTLYQSDIEEQNVQENHSLAPEVIASTDKMSAMAVPRLEPSAGAGSAQQLSMAEKSENLIRLMPQGTRVCILGGQAFKDPDSEGVVKSLATLFAKELRNQIVVVTGGMAGVQETFGKTYALEALQAGSQASVVNLLPRGQSSGFGVGQDMEAGADLEERKEIFALLGHIYITVEGGPGVAKEAGIAFQRGATVLPMISTGGASAGLLGFPPGALVQPSFVTPEQWRCLKEKVDPNEKAAAVVQILRAVMSKG